MEIQFPNPDVAELLDSKTKNNKFSHSPWALSDLFSKFNQPYVSHVTIVYMSESN